MRVSLVDPSAYTPPYDRSLAAALAECGADVTLHTSRFAYGPVPPARGYEVREDFYRASSRFGPGSRARLGVKAFEHLPQMLAARRRIAAADVAHWQWATAPRVDRFLLGRRSGGGAGGRRQPRVLTLHYPLPVLTDRREVARQRDFLGRFDAIITHTHGAAERLSSEFGIDAERVRVIEHGRLDYLTELPDPEPLPPELAAVEDPVVLFFGLLRPYKGIDTLLEAFAQLPAGNAELWIAGMPRMPLEPLREAIARVPSRVRLIPRFIPDPEIPALMRRADLLALPYREIEQSGVLYTGIGFGKPMILGDVGGFGEVSREHGVGALVPPGDAVALAAMIERLLADGEARDRLASATREAAEGPFSWGRIADRTLDLYRALLDGRG